MRRESLSAQIHPDLSIRLLCRLLEEEGLDPAPALRAAGLYEGLQRLPPRVSGRQEIAFQRELVRLTGYRPDLWLRAGLRYRSAAFGRLGLAYMTARNLEQMLENPLRMQFSYTPAHGRLIRADGEIVGLELDLSEVPDELREFSISHAVGAAVALYGDLWAGVFPFTAIRLSMLEPPMPVADLFPCPVEFGTERTELRWAPGASRRALPHADPLLHSIITEQLGSELEEKHQTDDLMFQVKSLLGSPDHANASLIEISQLIGMTSRTLQRRLTERGLNFRMLVEQIRRERAIGMLLSTNFPLSDIAFNVGYSELTGFEHAFKRWTGETPKRFRERIAAAGPTETVLGTA